MVLIRMKSNNIKKLFKGDCKGNTIILIGSVILLYLLISLYFINHAYFHTMINGADISLKSQHHASDVISDYRKQYELILIERGGKTEVISGQDIDMQYNEKISISAIIENQSSIKWIISIFKGQDNFINGLYVYDLNKLKYRINQLNCINKDIIEPQNVKFKYSKGSYEVIEETYGNKVDKDKLIDISNISILEGKMILNLNENHCYESPQYTLNSDKTLITQNLLNKYVSTNITYQFGNKVEVLDGDLIREWLTVDDNLEVIIDKEAVKKYVKELSEKYNTVGATRKFKTSVGKTVEVKGGLYGWKINQPAETKAILDSIKLGEVTKKEPAYIQRAISRDEDEIGNSYVEINITRQHVWFYKDGKLITQGFVVTGNPNKGNATVLGTHMLNYKQKGVILTGPGYRVEVTYWMPFYGNIGLHDASWRYSFGGEIYKIKGTHGCVNAPLYLAKTIYENIEEGIPIICYEE